MSKGEESALKDLDEYIRLRQKAESFLQERPGLRRLFGQLERHWPSEFSDHFRAADAVWSPSRNYK